MRPPHSYAPAILYASIVFAANTESPTAPRQPAQSGTVGTFQVVGNSIVSGQQLFLGTADKVYIVDKTENNPLSIKGHPAWAAEYSLGSNAGRPMDIVTNSFCAGGSVLANGTWVNVGGNQAITTGGAAAPDQVGASGPYHDPDGAKSVRILTPCDDGNCDWTLVADMSTRRWYPSLETLDDGSILIIGGCQWGGFVNNAGQTNPTYEFYPPRGDGKPIVSTILQNTLPANLYPLTFLLPSRKLLVQSNWQTTILDLDQGNERRIDDIPDAVRTYPASGGTVMLPLTPQNNWTATVMFCGGSNIKDNQWQTNWDIAQYPASSSCVQISPDISNSYKSVDPLPEGRTMGNLILLPTGQVLCLNGAATGVAGYGTDSWAIGMSYADQPIFEPVMYNPGAPSGSQWSRDGLSPSSIPRMYHSTATILPDGSVFVTGSNPNADFNKSVKYPTEYRVEKFYPSYFNERRPEPRGLPSQLSYGGAFFNVSIQKDDMFGDTDYLQDAKVVLLKPGFSTHTMNMGQRLVELQVTYTSDRDGSAVLHCSQLPPNPAIMPPGPALLFVVINGVPSVGVQVMVGSGAIGKQPVQQVVPLPPSVVQPGALQAGPTGDGGNGTKGGNQTSGALHRSRPTWESWLGGMILLLGALF